MDVAVGPVRQAKVGRVEPSVSGVRFRLTRETLAAAGDEADRPPIDAGFVLEVKGLPAGRYELRADGRPSRPGRPTSGPGASGSPTGPTASRSSGWRDHQPQEPAVLPPMAPQNITYLFGFRKHEQGNNAVEIPRFDPLVAEQEQEIARLRKPVAHAYELVRAEGEVGR